MKTKINFFLTAFIFCLTVTFHANSQISITNISEIQKVKNGTTYIVMKDPSSAKSKAYVDIFTKYWTISKIEFITYDEIEEHLSPQNSFLTIGGFIKSNSNYSMTFVYLKLWTCSEKFFIPGKKKKQFGEEYMQEVARLELNLDYKSVSNTNLLFQAEYDGDGHIRNWGPGILKNQIQTLTQYLNKNEKQGLYAGISNPTEIKKLQKETLYVPEYVLIEFNKFTGDESKKHSESDIFKGYELKYNLISIDGLNKKILDDEKAFYYLIYVRSNTDKYISVYNSVTGEIIYSKYYPASYNIKSSDLKDLYKTITK